MVYKLQLQCGYWIKTLISLVLAISFNLVEMHSSYGETISKRVRGAESWRTARSLYKEGKYFQSSRHAFSASLEDERRRPSAYAHISDALTRAGLYHSASYFFIQTLKTGDRKSIRRVLKDTEVLLVRVGADLLRNYLVKYTKRSDYDQSNLSAFLYSIGKQSLLKGRERAAIRFLKGIKDTSPLYPFAMQLQGTANALLKRGKVAIVQFQKCVNEADRIYDSLSDAEIDQRFNRFQQQQAEDLKARCQAGIARTYYQMNEFEKAERAYGEVSKSSFVWTDILFEQAWNAFSRKEYNRALGRLVSYKSPSLRFVFNSEIDVLRAQTYLMLCLYQDTNDVINRFNKSYSKVGRFVKNFVERNAGRLDRFYAAGKKATREKLHTKDEFNQVLNRFVRGPYFQGLVEAESAAKREQIAAERFGRGKSRGFSGFVQLVLKWRLKTIRHLGGAYVKNSLIDHHSVLISDFDKISFIKLEMLKRAKEQLINNRSPVADRTRGNITPVRRNDQYYWSFNGEFWNDEIGDYVFGLESQCGT